jgi:hypothetical protein
MKHKTEWTLGILMVICIIVFAVSGKMAIEQWNEGVRKQNAVDEGKAEWIYNKDGTREWRLKESTKEPKEED